MDFDYLKALRLEELRPVVRRLGELAPGKKRLLEIGAGAGWQAAELKRLGFDVRAVDVASSKYRGRAVFDVQRYDGERLPFENDSFDLVFSSNVLEHLPDPAGFQSEIRRVLEDDGLAVHTLPTATWRLWTMVTWYPELFRALFRRMARASRAPSRTVATAPSASRLSPVELIRTLLVAPRHGELGNALTEIWHFRSRRWQRLFQSTGWETLLVEPHGLFFTGNRLLGKHLRFAARRRLRLLLGSSTRTFYLVLRTGAGPLDPRSADGRTPRS